MSLQEQGQNSLQQAAFEESNILLNPNLNK